jgi:two-component system LytT family response regulator
MIVDDERLARRRLRSLIETIADTRIVAEAASLEEAQTLLTTTSVDLLFLDVQLAPENGFKLLPDVPPETSVVFVTAHANFAVRAFEEEALDYLVKPVREERLVRVIEKCRRQIRNSPRDGKADRFIFLGDRSNLQRVPVGEIAAILAEDTYSRVLTSGGGNVLVLRSLKEWTAILKSAQFVRLDRSVLVNLERVVKFKVHDRDHAEILIDGYKQPLHLGRVAIARAKKQFGNKRSGETLD